MCGGSVQPGVFTSPVLEMAALRRTQTMGGGPPVQEHVSVDPVEHRNGRKEQFAISPLRAGTPSARYLNRGGHCGAQARVENIDRPGSKLHLHTGAPALAIGVWRTMRGSRSRSCALAVRGMRTTNNRPSETCTSTGLIRGLPSRRIVPAKAKPRPSKTSCTAGASSGASEANADHETSVADTTRALRTLRTAAERPRQP